MRKMGGLESQISRLAGVARIFDIRWVNLELSVILVVG